MSGGDRERDVDDLLREGGGEIGDLYRRLPHYEPPRRLDRAILGEAARAMHSGQAPRRQRWIFGIGSAAGVVLAAGIAWRIGHDAMSQNETGSPASAPRVVPVQPITESARTKHEQPPAQDEAAPSKADATNAPSANAGRAATRNVIREEAKPELRKSRAPSPAGAVAPQPLESIPPAPAAAPPPAAFPDAARQDTESERARSSEPKDADAFDRTQAAGSQSMAPAAKAARVLSSPTPPSSSVELQRDMQLAPQDWLAHIRQLQRQGRTQQAMESLRLFRRAHPDWTIPDDLRDLSD